MQLIIQPQQNCVCCTTVPEFFLLLACSKKNDKNTSLDSKKGIMAAGFLDRPSPQMVVPLESLK